MSNDEEQSPPPIARRKKSKVWLWLVVFLIVGTFICYGLWAVFINGYGEGFMSPTGAFRSSTQISKDVYRITFGVVAPETQYKECTICIQPTMGNGSVATIVFVVTGGTFSQAATATTPGITITDLNADSKINIGDFVTVTTRSSSYTAADNGEWRISLIFIKTSATIASTTFMVSGNP
jgi:hypothetical protein